MEYKILEKSCAVVVENTFDYSLAGLCEFRLTCPKNIHSIRLSEELSISLRYYVYVNNCKL